MKSSLCLFLALTLITFISAFPSSDPCRWTDPTTGDSYDFSSLHREENWKLSDMSTTTEVNLFSIDFVFNFCKPTKNVCNGKGNLAAFEALEVMGKVTDACQAMGSMDQMDVVTGTTLGPAGVKITYKGGEKCNFSDNPSQNHQDMTTTFNIACGEAESEFVQLPYNGNTITKCTPEFYIRHPAGCVGGAYNTGSSLRIIKWILLIAVVYIVVGTVYNLKVQNKKGIEALPHVEFWKNSAANMSKFPVVMKDYAEKIVKKFKKGQNSSFMAGGLTGSSGNRNAKYTLV